MKRRKLLTPALSSLALPAVAAGKVKEPESAAAPWQAVETLQFDVRGLSPDTDKVNQVMALMADQFEKALKMILGDNAPSVSFLNIRNEEINPDGYFGFFRLVHGKPQWRGLPPTRGVPLHIQFPKPSASAIKDRLLLIGDEV